LNGINANHLAAIIDAGPSLPKADEYRRSGKLSSMVGTYLNSFRSIIVSLSG
jgi:hypothetical protein